MCLAEAHSFLHVQSAAGSSEKQQTGRPRGRGRAPHGAAGRSEQRGVAAARCPIPSMASIEVARAESRFSSSGSGKADMPPARMSLLADMHADHDVFQNGHFCKKLDILERAHDATAAIACGAVVDGYAVEGICPGSGFGAPEIRLNRVVFPAPLGPMSPLIMPPSTVKLTSLTACNPPNLRLRPETSTSPWPSLPPDRAGRRRARGLERTFPGRKEHHGKQNGAEHRIVIGAEAAAQG